MTVEERKSHASPKCIQMLQIDYVLIPGSGCLSQHSPSKRARYDYGKWFKFFWVHQNLRVGKKPSGKTTTCEESYRVTSSTESPRYRECFGLGRTFVNISEGLEPNGGES